MSDDQAPKEEKVGYKNPPKQSRFKPGQSGNPSGRPRRHPSIRSAVLEELRRSVVVRENNRRTKLTKNNLIAMSLVNGAAKGNLNSTKLLLTVIASEASDQPQLQNEALTADDEAIIQAELERRGGKDE